MSGVRNRVALDRWNTRCVVLDERSRVLHRLTAYDLNTVKTANAYDVRCSRSTLLPNHSQQTLNRALAVLPVAGDCCYVFYCHDSRIAKIGRTKSLLRRWSKLETEGGRALQLVAVWITDQSSVLERELHERFSAHRTIGEWFDADPVIDHVAAILAATR